MARIKNPKLKEELALGRGVKLPPTFGIGSVGDTPGSRAAALSRRLDSWRIRE